MEKSTFNYAMSLLNTHLKYCLEWRESKDYYNGLKNMLEVVISEGYSEEKYIVVDENGIHSLYDKKMKK